MTKKEARQQIKDKIKQLDKQYIKEADQLCIGKGIMEVRQIKTLADFEKGAYGIMEPSK